MVKAIHFITDKDRFQGSGSEATQELLLRHVALNCQAHRHIRYRHDSQPQLRLCGSDGMDRPGSRLPRMACGSQSGLIPILAVPVKLTDTVLQDMFYVISGRF